MRNEENPQPNLVSVVIPTFNDERYLEECIRSVMQQTLGNVQIVVVDDCSTDGTQAIVANIGAPNLHSVRHEINRGQAAARNTGLEIAQGQYVAFLDADDTMHPENLSRKVEALEQHPDVALVHSAVESMDEHGNVLGPRRSNVKRADVRVEQLFPALLHGNLIVHSSVLVRRNAVDDVGAWDPELRYADDWDLWIRLSRRYKFAYIDEQLVRKRVRLESVEWSGYVTNRDLEEAEKVLRKAFRLFPLEEEGFSFERLYGEHHYRKLNNKAELLPVRSFARMYFECVRRYPRGALGPPGIKAGIKLVASALLPQRFMLWFRVQRHTRRVAGVRLRPTRRTAL